MSSKIARAVMKTFRLVGTREKRRDRIPNASTIWVAVGMAQSLIATSSVPLKAA